MSADEQNLGLQGVIVGLVAGGVIGLSFGLRRWGVAGAIAGIFCTAPICALVGYVLVKSLKHALLGTLIGALLGAADGWLLALIWGTGSPGRLALWGLILGAMLGGIGVVPLVAGLSDRERAARSAESVWVVSRSRRPPRFRDGAGNWRSMGCQGLGGTCSPGAVIQCSVCGKEYCRIHGRFRGGQAVCHTCEQAILSLP